jgi:hypothetical protein
VPFFVAGATEEACVDERGAAALARVDDGEEGIRSTAKVLLDGIRRDREFDCMLTAAGIHPVFTNGQWCSYYQQIDDVKLTSGCQAKAGGLVVGHVREAKTQKALANIPVRNDASETTTTDDLGVYVLFSNAGLHTVKADPSSESGYRAQTRKVLVEARKVAAKPFALCPR